MQVEFRHLESIDSTNEEAKRVAKEFPEILSDKAIVFVAKTQTAGRGTHGKGWESDSEGGLYYTLLFRQPAFDFSQVSKYLREIAFVVVGTIWELTDIQTDVEWPNDIILDNKKCGGILLESASHAHSKNPHYVMIGIGLNLNQTSFSLGLHHVAISLWQKTQKIYDKNQFVETLTKELIAWQSEVFEAQSQ